MNVKIIIGADIVPTSTNEELFINKNVISLVGEECVSLLQNADYRVFNLEVPLVDEETPIEKSGPCLSAAIKTINGMDELGINLFTLANNHILDQGQKGLNSTIKVLKEHGISYVGIGDNLEAASKPVIAEIGCLKIGFFACAEHEFSLAQNDRAGANPFDPIRSFDLVHDLKEYCDYLIVLYHGGKEEYPYPTPELQKNCRKFIDDGADLVLVQHTHCIGAKEEHGLGTIVYGQGNFIFDGYNSEIRDAGLLISVQIDSNHEQKRAVQIEYIPIVKKENGIRIAGEEKSKEILNDFYERSFNIKKDMFVQQKYDELVEKEVEQCKMIIGGRITRNRIFRFMNKLLKGKLINLIYSRSRLFTIYDMICCESNRELLERALYLDLENRKNR